MSDDTQEQLETRIELEKDIIDTPEKTVDAARIQARAVAARLQARRKLLSGAQMRMLNRIADDLRMDLVSVAGDDDTETPEIEVCDDPERCAESFNDFAAACEKAGRRIFSRKLEAGRRLIRLARRLVSSEATYSPRQLSAAVRGILADVTKLDLMKNLSNIENKSQKDQTLRILVDWNDVARLSPRVGKFSKLQDLTVQDLKNILVCLRGGRNSQDTAE